MRVRPVPLLVSIFASAAAVSLFVVRQLPLEGDVSSPSPAPVAPAPAETSPVLDPPATAADGVVEVRVTAGGEPLAGAEIRLYLAPDPAGSPWRRAGEARTDGGGGARLHARAGVYLVAARAPGLAPGRGEVVRPGGGDAVRAALALEPPASLSGRVTLRSGEPAQRAHVRAVPVVSSSPGLDPPSAPPEETAAVEVDARGGFRLEGLSPGAWAVSIEAPGHHPVVLPRAAVPGEEIDVVLEPLGFVQGRILRPDGGPAAQALVRVASPEHGATARSGPDGRFTLAAPAGSYLLTACLGDRAGAVDGPVAIGAGARTTAPELRLGPAAVLHGTVVGPGGAAAAGAQVALLAHETRELVARAVAGRDGRFEVRGLAPVAYDVRAWAPGASPTWLPAVTLARGARFPLRIALAAAGAVEGTVREPGGRALAGVRVRAAVPGGRIAPAPIVEARTDFEGRFRLEPLDVGRAEVVARQDHVAIGVSGAVRVEPAGSSRLELVLPEAGVLAGHVSAAGGAPPAGTAVVAVPMAAGPGALQVARAAADASGHYELALPAGEYRVHAVRGGAAPPDVRAAPAFARVEAGRAGTLDLSLAPAAQEGGVEILVLEPGGIPSPGALVTLARPGDGRIAVAVAAGEDGRAVVGRAMGATGERVTLRARNGGRTGEETLALPSAGTVIVRLSPAGAVEGVVRGGAAGFTVEVSSQPAPGSWRTRDVHRFAGDRFELADLPAEPLRLSVRAADGRRGAAEVRLAPGERRSVEIALR